MGAIGNDPFEQLAFTRWQARQAPPQSSLWRNEFVIALSVHDKVHGILQSCQTSIGRHKFIALRLQASVHIADDSQCVVAVGVNLDPGLPAPRLGNFPVCRTAKRLASVAS
jgi:hypothetical protein